MILTTTGNIEGHQINEYHGIVFGEVVMGANIFRDFGASIRDVFGGRSSSYERSMSEGRQEVLAEISNRAQALGANAVIGLKIDYDEMGEGMIMISASGTAVSVQ